MKKLAGILLSACLMVSLTGCGRTAGNGEEMLQILAEKEGFSGEPSAQTIGTVEQDDAVLLCVMTGDENQGFRYYAAEWETEEDGYEFVRTCPLRRRGMDLYSLEWADGYVFLSNNADSGSLQIRFPNHERKDERIAIDAVPFVYYLDLSDVQRGEAEYAFEYYFLNGDGEAISQ